MRARVLARSWILLAVASLGCSRRGEGGAVIADAGAVAPSPEQSAPRDRLAGPQLAKVGESPPRFVGSTADVTCSTGEIPPGGYCRIATFPPTERTASARADALPDVYVEKTVVDAEGRTVLSLRSGRIGEHVFPVSERRELFDAEGRRVGRVETVYACRGVPTGLRRTTWRYEKGRIVHRSVEEEDATLEPCGLEGPGAPRVHRFEKVVLVASYGYDASGKLTTLHREVEPVVDTMRADASPSGTDADAAPDSDGPPGLRVRELVTLRRDGQGRVELETHARTFPGRAEAPPKDTSTCSYDADGRVERIATWQTTLAGERESVSELVEWATRIRRTHTRRRGSPVSAHVTHYAKLTPSPLVTTAIADDEDFQGCRFESLVQREGPDPIVLLRPPRPYENLPLIPPAVTLDILSPSDEPEEILNKLTCTSRDGVVTCTHVDGHGRTTTWKGTRRAGGELTSAELRTGTKEARRTALFSYEGGHLARVALEETHEGRPPEAVLFAYRYEGHRLVSITGSRDGRPYSLETYTYAADAVGGRP